MNLRFTTAQVDMKLKLHCCWLHQRRNSSFSPSIQHNFFGILYLTPAGTSVTWLCFTGQPRKRVGTGWKIIVVLTRVQQNKH